jgi:hypothetical protein
MLSRHRIMGKNMRCPRPFVHGAIIIVLAAIFGILPSAGALAADPHQPASVDWLHFRFDENHTGFQPHETTLDKSTIQSAGLLWAANWWRCRPPRW